MKIMLIEDNDNKYRAISRHLISKNVLEREIIHVKNMTDFAANLNADIGLFIIDFELPNNDSGSATQNGRSILEGIVKAGKHDAKLLAISSYPDEITGLRDSYESHGCILVEFSNEKVWKSLLDQLLIQLKKNIKLDFIIFCALQEERNPYIVLKKGLSIERGGIDCYDIEISNKRGTVVLLPQMGLVNAATIVSLCIDRYRPSIVGMSGICGGFKSRAELGQLFISQMSYEYQSGKWSSDGFKQEPYQVATEHLTLTKIKTLLHSENLIDELECGFKGIRPQKQQKPEVGIFASGSAVIANEKLLEDIQAIHRKVNALDMEVFAVQRAAELSQCRPSCICAKTVVDLCDANKNDQIHGYGSYISAKFLIKAIECINLNN